MLDCTYSPFPKIMSILTFPPLPHWSSFSELSEVLTPRPQLNLTHNSHIVLFFLSQPRDFGQFLSRSHTAESNRSVRLPSFPVEVVEMNLLQVYSGHWQNSGPCDCWTKVSISLLVVHWGHSQLLEANHLHWLMAPIKVSNGRDSLSFFLFFII